MNERKDGIQEWVKEKINERINEWMTESLKLLPAERMILGSNVASRWDLKIFLRTSIVVTSGSISSKMSDEWETELTDERDRVNRWTRQS